MAKSLKDGMAGFAARAAVVVCAAAIFSLSLAGCGGGNVSKLNGTWVYDGGKAGVGIYVLDNGKYQYKELYKGTYTVKGSTITFNQTHFKMGDDWEEAEDSSTALITSDTTFEINFLGKAVYTKQ